MNIVDINFHATLRDRIGTRHATLELYEGTCVKDLKEQLRARFPELASEFFSFLISINDEYALDEDLIPIGAKISFFPPISGGILFI